MNKNKEFPKIKKMENPFHRLKINKKFESIGQTKDFLNLTSSKCDLKSSNLIINQSPIKKIPRLQTDIDRNNNEVEILNTTNDKLSEGPEDHFYLNKEKSEGNLICKNRTIEPIFSLKNDNVIETGKYGRLSKYLLGNGKNKNELYKNKIETTNKFNVYKENKNFNKNKHRKLNITSGGQFESKQLQRANDCTVKITNKSDHHSIDNTSKNNYFSLDFIKNNSYKNINNGHNCILNNENKNTNNSIINEKTDISIILRNPIKKLNNTKISEDQENEYSPRLIELDNDFSFYNSNENDQNNYNNNNFIHQNNDKYINIVNKINTNNVNFFSEEDPIKKESLTNENKLETKKGKSKIYLDKNLELDRPITKMRDEFYNKLENNFYKQKNFKSISSKSNLIVNPLGMNNEFETSKNSSIYNKSPLLSNQGMVNFVNKAKLSIGIINNKNFSKNLYYSNHKENIDFYSSENLQDSCKSNTSINESFTDLNSNEKFFYLKQNKEKRFSGISDMVSNSEKINVKDSIISSSFKLGDSLKFSKANFNSNISNNFKDDEILNKPNLNLKKDLKKISLPIPNIITSNLLKEDDLNMKKNCLSKLDSNNFNNKFAEDIEFIIAKQRKSKESFINKDNFSKNNFPHLEEIEDRKKSITNNNNDENSYSSYKNREEINTEKMHHIDKSNEVVMCCNTEKIEYLNTNLRNSSDNNYNKLVIESTSIDIINKYHIEENKQKIIRIQGLISGFLLRKIYKISFKNNEYLSKLIILFEKLLNAKEFDMQKNFFKNLKIKRNSFILKMCEKFAKKIRNIYNSKIRSFKDSALRKIYLYSFTQQLSNEFQEKHNEELNKILAKQKSQYLIIQQEKEIFEKDLKFIVLITTMVDTKLLNAKVSFMNQLKDVYNNLKIKIEKKILFLKNIILYSEKKFEMKNSKEYLAYYQKALFVYWKSVTEKSQFLKQMRKCVLEIILNKKMKIKNDEDNFSNMITKRNKGEKINLVLHKNNIFFNRIKDSYNRILMHFHKLYITEKDSENKKNKQMFKFLKIIRNKKIVQLNILKKYFSEYKSIVNLIKNELVYKTKFSLLKNVNGKSNKLKNFIKYKFEQWQNKATKLSNRNKKIINLLLVKISKNFIMTRTSFKNFRYKAKKISIFKRNFNTLSNSIGLIKNKLKLVSYVQLIKKLNFSAKWKSGSKEIKIVTINAILSREILQKNIKLLENKIVLCDDDSIEDFSIEKNFRFKTANGLWKLSNQDRLILRYYLIKYLNRTNMLSIKELKKNSFKWSSDTLFKEIKLSNKSELELFKEESNIDNYSIKEKEKALINEDNQNIIENVTENVSLIKGK